MQVEKEKARLEFFYAVIAEWSLIAVLSGIDKWSIIRIMPLIKKTYRAR